MKLLLVTPLYPPDIAEPAPYMKELARRLSERHEVTVLAYGKYPEKLPGVTSRVIDKGRPLASRLIEFTRALTTEAKRTDAVYASNGASVEFPLVLASFLLRKPIVFAFADAEAHKRASPAHRLLERLARLRSGATIRQLPLPRPEVLPLAPYPAEAFEAYERSWSEHLSALEPLFKHD